MRDLKIDSLKGIAIIFVLINHSLHYHNVLAPGTEYLVAQAVPIFIILAGYNGVNSYLRRDACRFMECHRKTLYPRLIRLLLPYTIMVLIEAAILSANPIKLFLIGGAGPGAHFVPVMIQLVLTLPLLYVMAKKDLRMMLLFALAIELIIDIYQYFWGISPGIYARAYPRYIFAAALGVCLAMNIDKKWVALGGVLSIWFISLNPNLHSGWGATNTAPGYLWSLTLVIVGLRFLPVIPIVPILGKASYHIFLIQMTYFINAHLIVDRVIGLPYSPRNFLADIIICLGFGITFYYVEIIARRYIHQIQYMYQVALS